MQCAKCSAAGAYLESALAVSILAHCLDPQGWWQNSAKNIFIFLTFSYQPYRWFLHNLVTTFDIILYKMVFPVTWLLFYASLTDSIKLNLMERKLRIAKGNQILSKNPTGEPRMMGPRSLAGNLSFSAQLPRSEYLYFFN